MAIDAGAAKGSLIRVRHSDGLAAEGLVVPAAVASLVSHEGEELVFALCEDGA